MLVFKFTGPKTTSTAQLRGQFMNAGKWTARKMKRLLAEYVAPFHEVKPAVREHATYEGGNVYAVLELEGGEAGGAPVRRDRDTVGSNLVLLWINNGTRTRYATMTKGFAPKTTPNTLKTGPGAGGKWFVSKKKPHKGLEARNFFQLIAEEGLVELNRRVDDIMANI